MIIINNHCNILLIKPIGMIKKLPTKINYPGFKPLLLAVILIACAAAPGRAFQEAPAVRGSSSDIGAHDKTPHPDLSSTPWVADLDQDKHPATGGDKRVDALINPPPKNDRIFHVGPQAERADHDRTEERSGGRQLAGGSQQSDLTASATDEAQKPEVEEAAPEEKWIQMDLDQKGTYLFFGEDTETDETLNGTETPAWPDYGVGIGKKWHF